MIFQYTWPQVLSAHKTQTRRIIRPGEEAIRMRYNQIAAITHNGRIKWRVGEVYAVQPGRGKRQIARVRLVRIRSEHVTRISTAEAIAEGFNSRQEFLATWQGIHGPQGKDCRVWVLEFRLVSACVDRPKHLEYHSRGIGVPAFAELASK